MKIVIDTRIVLQIAIVARVFLDVLALLYCVLMVALMIAGTARVSAYGRVDVGVICYIGLRVFLRELLAVPQDWDAVDPHRPVPKADERPRAGESEVLSSPRADVPGQDR